MVIFSKNIPQTGLTHFMYNDANSFILLITSYLFQYIKKTYIFLLDK
jgi:hypothetical protein